MGSAYVPFPLHARLEGILRCWSSEPANYATNDAGRTQNLTIPWFGYILALLFIYRSTVSGYEFAVLAFQLRNC